MSNKHVSSSSSSSKETEGTAYTVFASVDARVGKPVLGSDGAAAWQNFRNSNSSNSNSSNSNKTSVAPTAPLKAGDRAAGFASWRDERHHEARMRAQAGDADLNAGYTHFAPAPSSDAMTTKERRRVEQRGIGKDQDYFVPAKTWQGAKWDYVFTTKQGHGTGYFFDGMDSLKQLRAGSNSSSTTEQQFETENSHSKKRLEPDPPATKASKPKKSKKKAASVAAVTVLSDPTNPLQQVAAALQSQRQAQQQQTDWDQAVDPVTKKHYYYNRTTGERTWEAPLPWGWQTATDPDTEKPYYYHAETGVTVWEKPSLSSGLPS